MEIFFERHQLPKLTQDEIENLNRSITNKKIRCVILKVTTKENTDLKTYSGEFQQLCKEGLINKLCKIFKKNRRGGNTFQCLTGEQKLPKPNTQNKRKQQTDN